MKGSKEDYDLEPVRYCSQCYSLKIRYEDIIESDCCMDCGCSDIKETTIDNWETLYEGRYGHKYVTKSLDVRNSPIFKLSISSLKALVYEDENYRDIIKAMYPAFPEGLGKADSIIILFDKLIKDNRIDDLKILLINKNRRFQNGREEKSKADKS